MLTNTQRNAIGGSKVHRNKARMKPTTPPAPPWNILFFNPDIYRTGGSNISIIKIIAGLDRTRFRPFMAIPENNEYQAALDELEVKTVPYTANLGWFPTPRHFHRHLASLRTRVDQVAELISQNEIHLVCTNSDNVFEAPLACLQTRIPHIWRQNSAFDGRLDIFNHFPLTPESQACLIAELSTKVVCVSRTQSTVFLSHVQEGKVETIESIIEGGQASTTREQARSLIQERLSIDPSKTIILNVGRASPEKDLITFCRTAKELIKRLPERNFTFLHVGSTRKTDYMSEIRSYLQEQELERFFIFSGEVEPQAVAQFYQAADVFLFTSKREGFARGCAEAMLAGTPVVSTRCSGPADYISNGENGFLAEIGDFESLASATCKILETPTLAEEFVKRARLEISEHYNSDRIRLKWNRLFEDSIVNFKNNDSSSALACQLVTNTFTQLGQTQVRLDEFERRLEALESLRRLVFDNKIATRIKAIVSRFRTARTT